MRESPVENRLRNKLQSFGCIVVKLTCPGHSHVMDRMVIRPKWSPGPPWVVEVKRPGKDLRRAQELTGEDWIKRGMRVLPFVNDYATVDNLADYVYRVCESERTDGR